VFNNIRHLKLSDIGIDSNQSNFPVNLDLENLAELELNHCRFREIVAWNSSLCLKKVTITCCNMLASIPPLVGIPVVSIYATSSLTHFKSSGCQEKFSCIGSRLDEATMVAINQPSFYHGLKELELNCTFDVLDFSFCQHIPVLDLSIQTSSYRSDPCPPLPILYGKELRLYHFSLASWNGVIFSNVLKCELKSCIDLIDFPEWKRLNR
jgi:hypothetical protein